MLKKSSENCEKTSIFTQKIEEQKPKRYLLPDPKVALSFEIKIFLIQKKKIKVLNLLALGSTLRKRFIDEKPLQTSEKTGTKNRRALTNC